MFVLRKIVKVLSKGLKDFGYFIIMRYFFFFIFMGKGKNWSFIIELIVEKIIDIYLNVLNVFS